MFLLGDLLPFLDRLHEVIGDFLGVGGRLVHLLRVLVERLDPALDVRGASAAVVADAHPITRHHRGHFRAEFFAGVLHAAEVPGAGFKGVAVHPLGVAGGVTQFVEGGLVIPVRGRKLLTLGQRHLVRLDVVKGPVAAHVGDVDAALLDHPLGGLVRLPLGRCGAVVGRAFQRQPVGLFDVEHGIAADHRRARLFLLALALGRRGAGLLLGFLLLVVKLVKQHLGGLLAFTDLPAQCR